MSPRERRDELRRANPPGRLAFGPGRGTRFSYGREDFGLGWGLELTRPLHWAQQRLLKTRACPCRRRGRFDDVVSRPRVRHQRGELLQRADLIRTDPSHCFGGFARLLREIEHAAAQLLSSLVEFTLNLTRHFLHFGDRLTEAVRRVIKRASELRIGHRL